MQFKDYKASDVRNVVVLGHANAGKSSLIEAALYYTKAIEKYGCNNDGTSALNYDIEEGKRRTSVYCHIAPVLWKEKKINFIDTPGYLDYQGEQVTGIRVGDNALIIVDAKESIKSGTIRAFKLAMKEKKITNYFFH